MAVKVYLKEDDTELVGAEIRKGRYIDYEIVEVFDSNGVILYAIPFHQVRIIKEVYNLEPDEIPQAVESRGNLVHIQGTSSQPSTEIECDFVRYERFINEAIVQLFYSYDETSVREFTIPFDNIIYINFNHIPSYWEETVAIEEVPQKNNRPILNKQSPAKPVFRSKIRR